MTTSPLTTRIARPQDAEAWLSLCYMAQDQLPPADLSDQITLFLSSPPAVAENRFLCWLSDEPIACWTLSALDNVIELRDFFIVNSFLPLYGVQVLEQVIMLVKHYGTVLTTETYPAVYSPFFLRASFKQNTRTMMVRSLRTYQIQIARLPEGVRLRHPRLDDEDTVVEMVYKNYAGSVDQDMVSSSKAQAAAMIHSIFGEEYCGFDLESSFLAEDEQQHLIGDIFLGDMSTPDAEQLIQIVDISVSPQWRGKGLGRALLLNGLNAARTKRYATIRLMVTLGNDRAIALYRSCGFQRYGDLMYEASLQLTN